MIVGCASQPRAATGAHKVMTDLAHVVDPQLRAALVSMPEIEVTAEATLDWTTTVAAELGLDPAQIFVGGTSSGANLAAGLAVRRRDRGSGPAVAFQLLLYPVLDDRLATPSMHGIADRRTITREFARR